MRIYLGGHLNFYNQGEGNWLEVTVQKSTRLKEIITNSEIPLGEVQLVVLNDEMADLEAIVTDKDKVSLYSAVGGG